MPTVTLIAAPHRRDLDPALVDSLRNAWGGGVAEWLSPDEAAAFSVAKVPENRWDVWEECQRLGVDLVVQAEARPRRLLLADMDSTMTEQECIDELAAMAGVGEEVSAITARAMNGELDFEGALKARVALLEGLDAGVIRKVLQTRITLASGGMELVATMRAHGGYAALVSGGFTDFTADVAAQLGFDEHRANTLLVERGRLTGRVAEPILGRDAKVRAFHDLTARLGIGPGEVIAVGDGANDLGMLELAGAGVALHAKPAVAAECEVRVNHGDLTSLLFLQGYRRDQFAAV